MSETGDKEWQAADAGQITAAPLVPCSRFLFPFSAESRHERL